MRNIIQGFSQVVSLSVTGNRRLAAATVLLGALLTTAPSATAQGTTRYQARPGSKVTIAGTSTLHDWTMDGQIIGGFLEVPAAVVFDQSQAAPPGLTGGKLAAHAEVSIPVRSMKSGHDGMDEVMQQAMNETNHPRILYHVTEMTLKQPHPAGKPFEFDTKGDLIVNGITNSITMPVTIDAAEKPKLKIDGKVALKMSTFKVKPPKLGIALGLVNTGDDITITFDWIVAPRPVAAAATTNAP